jgi:hypothetical protein
MPNMLRWLQAGLLICNVAASPALAQSTQGTPDTTAPAPTPAPSAQPHARASSFVERFKAANTTGDGQLTLAQAEAGNLKVIAQNFDAIDSQHKGYVTLDDIRAYRQKMRAERQGGTATTE